MATRSTSQLGSPFSCHLMPMTIEVPMNQGIEPLIWPNRCRQKWIGTHWRCSPRIVELYLYKNNKKTLVFSLKFRGKKTKKYRGKKVLLDMTKVPFFGSANRE